MSATMSLNGRPRTQLADQLDRLDGILDLLGDGLTEAVTDAVKNGTRVAVKDAILEILTNPELLAAVRGSLPTSTASFTPVSSTTAAAPPNRPSLWARLKAKLQAVKTATIQAVSRVKARVGQWIGSIRSRIARGGHSLSQSVGLLLKKNCGRLVSLIQMVGQAKRVALLATGIGTTTGLLSLLAPQLIAALTSALTFALAVVGVQLAVRARQFWQRILPA